jgi:hypothetical protein
MKRRTGIALGLALAMAGGAWAGMIDEKPKADAAAGTAASETAAAPAVDRGALPHFCCTDRGRRGPDPNGSPQSPVVQEGDACYGRTDAGQLELGQACR